MQFWFVPRYLNFVTFSKNLSIIMILSCILVTRHEHIFILLRVYL
jgi:hypothetical protein